VQAKRTIAENKYRCVIEIDGGIDTPLIPSVVEAGASVLVVGSAIFGRPDPGAKVKEMLETVRSLRYHSDYV